MRWEGHKLHLESHTPQAPFGLTCTRSGRFWLSLESLEPSSNTICSVLRPCLYGIYSWISHTGVILSTMGPKAHVVLLLGLPKRPHTNGNSKPPYKPRSLSFF